MVLVDGTPPHAVALTAHFARVLHVRNEASESPWLDGSVARVRAMPARLPVGSASVDSVVLARPLSADWTESLVEAGRVIRSGGCLAFGLLNRRWMTRSRRAQRAGTVPSLRSVLRAAADAGFARVDVFYIDPSLDYPMRLIQQTSRATASYELQKPIPSRLTRLRWQLARAGLHAVLYPAYFCLGYR